MDVLESPARRKLVLNAFLASIGVNALLGIWALLVDDFGQTQGKILTTSFLVSAAMLSVLINGAPLGQRVLWPVPVVATGAALLGFLLLVIAVWTEPQADAYPKLMLSAFIVAAGGTLAGLLALLALRPSHRWLRMAGNALIVLLSVTATAALWAEPDADWVPRLIGVESVLVAAVTLALPALARFLPPAGSLDVAHSLRFCPSCGAPLGGVPFETTPLTCPRCGLTFAVTQSGRADDGSVEMRPPGYGSADA